MTKSVPIYTYHNLNTCHMQRYSSYSTILSLHTNVTYVLFYFFIGTVSHSDHVDMLYRVQGGTLPQESQLHIVTLFILFFISLITMYSIIFITFSSQPSFCAWTKSTEITQWYVLIYLYCQL